VTTAEQIAKVFDLDPVELARHFAETERMTSALMCNCTCHVIIGGGTDTRRDRQLERMTECWHCRLLADPHVNHANLTED
jgi:hypothetical protein